MTTVSPAPPSSHTQEHKFAPPWTFSISVVNNNSNSWFFIVFIFQYMSFHEPISNGFFTVMLSSIIVWPFNYSDFYFLYKKTDSSLVIFVQIKTFDVIPFSIYKDPFSASFDRGHLFVC